MEYETSKLMLLQQKLEYGSKIVTIEIELSFYIYRERLKDVQNECKTNLNR